MPETLETSVIILGGSLVGLSSAVFLAAQHVPFILIERHASSSPHPRALGWTHRTMELFRSVGIDKALPSLPPGTHSGKARRVKTTSLNGEWSGESHWSTPNASQTNQPTSGKPGATTTRQPPVTDLGSITPVHDTTIAQDGLEPILRNRVVELGGDLRLGCVMTSWSQNSNGVTITATDSNGNNLTVNGKYLIACDGANSRVRKDLSIAASGVGYIRTLRSILFRCPSIEHYLSRGIQQWSIENGDFKAFLVTYSDGRWALMTDDPSQEAFDENGQKAMIQQAIGEARADIELLAHGEWDLSASVADRFSSGRVFLAGDAAHILPPSRGGYGANTGIADVHNLAWKLAAVLSGDSAPSLLESYDQERRPVALVRHDQIFARDDYRENARGSAWEKDNEPADIIDDVAMELGQLYRSDAIIGSEDEHLPTAQTPAQWAGQPGTRAPHIALKRPGDGGAISSLDLFGRNWILLSEDSRWRNNVCGFVEVGRDVQKLQGGAFRSAFGLDATGAVLVRPDGYIAARWASAPDDLKDSFGTTLRMVAHLAD